MLWKFPLNSLYGTYLKSLSASFTFAFPICQTRSDRSLILLKILFEFFNKYVLHLFPQSYLNLSWNTGSIILFCGYCEAYLDETYFFQVYQWTMLKALMNWSQLCHKYHTFQLYSSSTLYLGLCQDCVNSIYFSLPPASLISLKLTGPWVLIH